MECRRCGEDNLPGLARCVGCGGDLAAGPPALPASLVPRVAARDPLEGMRRRPPRRSALPATPAAGLSTFLVALIQAAPGLLPGLMPALRGGWRSGLPWWGASLGLVGLGALTWRGAGSTMAALGLVVTCAAGATAEGRLALGHLREPGRSAASLWLGLTATALALTALLWPLQRRYPLVEVASEQRWLPHGIYLADGRHPAKVQAGQLVGLYGRHQEAAGLVIATSGQEVVSDGSGVWVDGAPVDVERLLENGPYPLKTGPWRVPDAHFVILQRSLHPYRPDEATGPLWYRLFPAERRGPLEHP